VCPVFKRIQAATPGKPVGGEVSRVTSPRRLESHAIAKHLADEDVMSRVPTILSSLNYDSVVPGLNKLTGTSAGVVTQGTAALASVHHYYKERNAAGEMTAAAYGPFGVHALVDPNGPPSRQVLVWEDVVQLHKTAGVAMQCTVGFVDNVTANDFTTKTGIGFFFDAAGTATWHAFVREASAGYVAPYTDLYDLDLNLGAISNDPNVTNVRRLCLVLDGRSKRIRWYVDGLQVAEYLYAATPGRIAGTTGVFLRYRLFVPAATTSRIRQLFGGVWQHIRSYDIFD
jgi:hypothetical protein